MLGKKAEAGIFAFERKAPGGSAPGPEPYFPFAQAWKEFDALENAVHGKGKVTMPRRVAEFLFLLLALGIIRFHPSPRGKLLIIAGVATVFVAEMCYRWVMRKRFRNRACPRCHSEWPGEKNKKAPACKAGGLRLHQLAP